MAWRRGRGRCFCGKEGWSQGGVGEGEGGGKSGSAQGEGERGVGGMVGEGEGGFSWWMSWWLMDFE